ncbi:MAG: hypothetical protein ACOYKM_00555 [Caulobacterales bacterium]|jgi:uncharacterized membrane protein
MTAVGRLTIDPLAPLWVIASLAVVAAALLAYYTYQRGGAPVTRGLGLALILVGLLQPMWVRERREPSTDVAVILVDQSDSLALAGRLEAARTAGDALAERLANEPGLEVRVRDVRSGPDGTLLVSALQDAIADIPAARMAGALLVTDGQAADAASVPAVLRDHGPIHALIVGDPNRGDRRLELIAAPAFGIVGENVTIEARVEDPTPGRPVAIRATIDGQTVRTVQARTGEPFTLRLATPKRGANMVQLEAEAGPQEITLLNNRAAFNLAGVRDRLRVLLVTGEPHAGARVWRNLLKSDPAVDLVHFTILRPPEKTDFLAADDEISLIPFPTRQLFVDELDRFDLIIFDRYRQRGVLEQSYFFNIARRVEAGGALLVTAGEADATWESLFQTPLAAILPAQPTGQVVTTPYRPTPTEIGARHPIIRGLPDPARWGRWTRQIAARATSGQTLLSGAGDQPLLTIATAGRGRVAQFWSDQVWLWARGYEGGGPHGELLRRLLHWLMQEPELDAERLTLTTEGNTLTVQRSTLADAAAPAVIVAPDGSETQITFSAAGPGLWRAQMAATAQGLYEARSQDLRAFAAVGPLNPVEAEALNATAERLQPLVQQTGGGEALLGEDGRNLPELRRVDANARTSGEGWLGLRRNEAYVVRSAASQPLGPGWLWALLGLALFMFGWRRETR